MCQKLSGIIGKDIKPVYDKMEPNNVFEGIFGFNHFHYLQSVYFKHMTKLKSCQINLALFGIKIWINYLFKKNQ